MSMTGITSQIEGTLGRKVWGERSFTIGDMIGLAALAVGIYMAKQKKSAKWLYGGAVVCAILVILF